MRIQLSKIALIAIAVNFSLSIAFANIPKNCAEELSTISKLSQSSGFDLQAFINNLPPAVAKAKLQAKSPSGQPKDSDIMDLGMTFGCLKDLPESPSEIASLFRDINQVAAQPQYMQQPPPQYVQQPPPQYMQQPPPQYGQPPVQYIYVPQPVQQVQCPQCPPCWQANTEPANFSAGQRWGTWFLNNLFPGLGSATVMGDYAGMGIQMALSGLGIISITVLGFEEECDYHGYGYDCYTRFNEFVPIGIALLGTSAIYNIIRSASYDKPKTGFKGYDDYGSNTRGFNLAVLPNRHGEIMPYLMYNRTF